MLVKTPSQWAISSAPNVNHPCCVVEKVDPNLPVEIDGLCTNVLHAENLRRGKPVNQIASPEHPEGGNNLILDFIFLPRLYRCGDRMGDSRVRLPNKKPPANLLERALISFVFDCP